MPCARRSTLMILSMGVLSACAGAAAPVTQLRVLVQLTQPSGDAARIAASAARSSGKPVSYVASSGGDWHALALTCSDAQDCDAALQRLRADHERFRAVQPDERKRFVTP
jgi:hypothetical protein